jgi:hypothetical protein
MSSPDDIARLEARILERGSSRPKLRRQLAQAEIDQWEGASTTSRSRCTSAPSRLSDRLNPLIEALRNRWLDAQARSAPAADRGRGDRLCAVGSSRPCATSARPSSTPRTQPPGDPWPRPVRDLRPFPTPCRRRWMTAMELDSNSLEVLSRDECLALLASTNVARRSRWTPCRSWYRSASSRPRPHRGPQRTGHEADGRSPTPSSPSRPIASTR